MVFEKSISEMATIPFYFMWSKEYRFFYEILKATVKDSRLPLMPIEIDQSVFDRELYQIENEHFWQGSLIKVNTILDTLNTASSKYIIFSDIDCIFKAKLYDTILPYIEAENDIVYLKESRHINIGFMLFRVCPEVISFWELIKAKMIENPTLDQKYVNELMVDYPGKWSCFDDQLFACSNTWDGKTDFAMLQLLCSCLGKEFNMAEKIFYSAQHINIEPYMQYVKPEIIPFIYRFQEILVRSHKKEDESKTNSAVNT